LALTGMKAVRTRKIVSARYRHGLARIRFLKL